MALMVGALSMTPAAAAPDEAAQTVAPVLRRDGNHFPASIKTTVPPGGNSTITSPTIPKDTMTVLVELAVVANAVPAEVEAFDKLTSAMGKMTKGNRLLTCIMLYNALVTTPQLEDDYGAEVTFQANEASLALVALVGCIRLAGLGSSTQPTPTVGPSVGPSLRRSAPAAQASGTFHKCVRDHPGVPGTINQSNGVFTLSVDGAIKKARNQLRIGCRTKSGKTILKVRAAKNGVPLRKVLGKRPRLSIVSPADAEASAPTKVTFRLP